MSHMDMESDIWKYLWCGGERMAVVYQRPRFNPRLGQSQLGDDDVDNG